MQEPIYNAVVNSEIDNPTANTIDFRKIMGKVLNILPWVIVSVILSLVLAKLYLRYTVPVYEVQSQILVIDGRLSGGGQSITNEFGLGVTNKSMDNEMDIYSSFSLIKRAVDSLHLDIEVQEEGRIKKMFVYGESAPFKVLYCKRGNENENSVFNFVSRPGGIEVLDAGGNGRFYSYADTVLLGTNKLLLQPVPEYLSNPVNRQRIYFRNAAMIVGKYKGQMRLAPTKEYGGIMGISVVDEIPQRAVDLSGS